MKLVIVQVIDGADSSVHEFRADVNQPDTDGKVRAAVGEFLSFHIGRKYKYQAAEWIKQPREDETRSSSREPR